LYGSGQQSSKTASTASSAAATTLGQEEKQRKRANFVNRLHRIRAQQVEYDALTAPLHDAFDLSQIRRTQTLQKQQQQYTQSIEDDHPVQHRHPHE
jgi:hypothetical protein